jgi:hypothetical protein
MTALVETPLSAEDMMSTMSHAPASDGEIPHVQATDFTDVFQGSHAMHATPPEVRRSEPIAVDPFKLSSEYAYTPRKLKVFTIGAGFSGLLMAHKFQHRFPEMRDIVDHTIFEALHDVGGTWLVNDYPGVQCDVPAHIYVSRWTGISMVETFSLK